MKLIKFACLVLLAGLLSIPAHAADVAFSLSWSPPVTGGPVESYAASCVDSGGTNVLSVATATTTAAGSAQGVAEGAGSCSLIAIGPGGTSAPVVAAFSITVTAPPGPPTDFTITLQCTVVEGVAVCEQV